MNSIADCQRRRQQWIEKLSTGQMLFITSAAEVIRNGDNHYPYRQDSNFHYLTNFPEAGSALIIAPGSSYGDVIFFCAAKDPQVEQWTGKRLGLEAAKKDYKFDNCFSIEELPDILAKIIIYRKQIYLTSDAARLEQKLLQQYLNENDSIVTENKRIEIIDLDLPLAQMRLIKDDSELNCMQKAADIAIEAHKAAWEVIPEAGNEAELSAAINSSMEVQFSRPSYPSIVAAGENALVLHYQANNQSLQKSDLVLIDAGAEFNCYASDITRTVPLSGKFNKAQTDVYQCVLDAQLAVIAAIKPGVKMKSLQEISVKTLCQGLIDLNILKNTLDECIDKKLYQKFYMHGVSHWLGLDVHDCIAISRENTMNTVLAAGMCLTVEPGLYISPSNDVAEKYHNIGVRIEDDVVVTSSGCKVLSAGMPKSINDIENFFSH